MKTKKNTKMKRKIVKLISFSVKLLKLLFAWLILHTINRKLIQQNIWLIREKRDEARDNGYHFFKYLRENHPEINVFYVITQNSTDRHKVEKYSNLINADSLKHCVYYLAAKLSINSQQFSAYPFHLEIRELNIVQKLCNPKQKVVFLQHGITKDYMDSFIYGKCNIDYIVTSTKQEYEFVKEQFKYPDNRIGHVGLARFDNLHIPHVIENQILVMPTWRKWLINEYQKSTPNNDFSNSSYFISYASLLNDIELIQFLRDRGIKLVFYLHYALQNQTQNFNSFKNDVISIASSESCDVQELLMSSKFMITDYSSVAFDFAYMNKPLAYYQFDKEQYRANHYAEGYFSYEKNGFGPCFDNFEDMKQYIFEIIENDCIQPEKYDLRVKDFFDLRDNHNCERTFNALNVLEKQ